ncbi:MAG: hypothetical protein IJX34_02090 [Clostridia bacterium]|nr:hypothetical protein [Clostridia bacterium]
MGRLNEMAQGAKKGVVNFMLAGDYKEGALAHIDEQHKKAIQKADEKAAKKKEKIEAKEVKRAEKAELKANRIPLRERVSNFFTASEVEEEIIYDDGHVIFYGENDEQYNAIIIDAKTLLNEKREALNAESLRGQTLLKRNLKTSPLFIDDEGNMIRVTSIQEVLPEEENKDKAYVLLETKYEYFVIEFNVNRSF